MWLLLLLCTVDDFCVGGFKNIRLFLIKSNWVENDLHKNLCFYRKTFLSKNHSDLQLDSIQYGQFSLGQIISFL